MEKTIEFVLSYSDIEDHDNGTNNGFVEFENERSMVDWVNNEIKTRPCLRFKAFSVISAVNFTKEEVVTRYRVD